MKTRVSHPGLCRIASPASAAAFTLPELMITLSLFLLLLGGILSAHLFGMRLSGMTQAKLKVSTSARQVLGKMTEEIRGCTSTWVGNVTNGMFTEILDGTPQAGSALLVQPTTNASVFVLYFINSADHSFRRTTSPSGTTTIVARSVTNDVVFRAQDFAGNVLTNNHDQRVIHLSLEFYQPQPLLPVADYYRLETSVTRRASE